MRDIQIDDETHDRLLVTARLMDESIGDVIRRLVNRLTTDDAPFANQPISMANHTQETTMNADTITRHASATATATATEWIAIFKVYKTHRLEGTFNPRTHEVRLSTAPWANKVFTSPTAAAVAVVEHFSGDVRESPNTNGRKFWKVTSTGKNLRSIIGER